MDPHTKPVLDALQKTVEELTQNLHQEAATLGRVWFAASELVGEEGEEMIAQHLATLVAMATTAAQGDMELIESYERALNNSLTGLRLRAAEQQAVLWQKTQVDVIRGIAKAVQLLLVA